MKYYATFVENSYICFELVVVALNESYQWLVQKVLKSLRTSLVALEVLPMVMDLAT